MDAAHFPRASRLLELVGAVYAGRMVATVNEDGKVTIRRKESTTCPGASRSQCGAR